MAINIALYEPEIAPNTGNIIRLCANTGAALHILGKPGFEWDDKRLRRAGLDYHEWANVAHWPDYQSFLTEVGAHSRVFAMSTKGARDYHQVSFAQGDSLLFGPETRGLPDTLLQRFGQQEILRIPMRPDSRSLNLSNSVAIATYEAWRQLDFTGAKPV